MLFILSATPVAALQGAYRSPRVSRTRVQRGLRIRRVPTTEDLTSATSGVALHAAAVPVSTVPESVVAKENANFRGAVSIAGGVLAHLILGAMYCWGNFLSYAPASLLFFDGLAHPGMTPDAIQVLPLALVAVNLGMPIGARMNKKFGPRITTLLGCALMVLGTYLASFQTRLAPFMLYYSLMAGVGTGLGYNTPMIAGWSWFPRSKGLINGLILFGFGSGAFVFNNVATSLAQSGVLFGPMLRKLALMYAAASLVGSLLIKAKPPVTVKEAENCELGETTTPPANVPVSPPEACEEPGATFKQAVTSRRFSLLWLIGLMAFTPGITVMGLYKSFGMSNPAAVVANDQYLSLVGGVGAVFSGFGKMFWGIAVDKIGFLKGYSITTVMQIALMLALPFAAVSKVAFAAAVCGALFCLGGSIAMYVTCNAQTFGVANAGEIYSVLFSSLALASIVGAKLTIGMLPIVGWHGIFTVLGGMGLINFGMLKLFKRETDHAAPWVT